MRPRRPSPWFSSEIRTTLNEFRGDPILGRYLKPFKPEARLGLAVVKPGDLAAVQALLAERGVELTQAH